MERWKSLEVEKNENIKTYRNTYVLVSSVSYTHVEGVLQMLGVRIRISLKEVGILPVSSPSIESVKYMVFSSCPSHVPSDIVVRSQLQSTLGVRRELRPRFFLPFNFPLGLEKTSP